MSIKYKSAVLFGGVETIEGTRAAITAASAMLAKEITYNASPGDTEQEEFSSYDAGRYATLSKSPRAELSAKVPMIYSSDPVAATPPPISALLRAAGFDEYIDATDGEVRYIGTDGSNMDSVTLELRRKKNGTTNLLHQLLGARGTIGIDVQANNRFIWDANYQSSYIRPSEDNFLAEDFGDQKANLMPLLNPRALPSTVFLDGHAICIESFTCDNLGGLDIEQTDLVNCSSVDGDPVTPTASIKYRDVGNWGTALHPFRIGEMHEALQELPLVIQFGDNTSPQVIRFEFDKVQPQLPTDTEIGKGDLGKEQQLNLLSPTKIFFTQP